MFSFMQDVMQLNMNYTAMNGPIQKPVWRTPHTVVWSDGKTECLEYRKGKDSVVIVAPEAAHDSTLVDWAENQSLVQCALDNTTGGVYVINKLPAKAEHAHLNMEYMFVSLDNILQTIPGFIDLVGLCQGGPQAAITAASWPEKIKSLTIVGAPMKTSAAISSLQPFLDEYPQEEYEKAVNDHPDKNMDGKLMLMGFLADKPNTFRHDETVRWANADNPKFVEKDRIFRNWYYSPQNVPGVQYLELIARCFRDDLENWYDLTQGDYPVNLVAGTKDPICPIPQVFAFSKHCKGLVTYWSVPAGHIGIFMGTKAVAEVWTPIFKAME